MGTWILRIARIKTDFGGLAATFLIKRIKSAFGGWIRQMYF
jgi:hypothetical protein